MQGNSLHLFFIPILKMVPGVGMTSPVKGRSNAKIHPTGPARAEAEQGERGKQIAKMLKG